MPTCNRKKSIKNKMTLITQETAASTNGCSHADHAGLVDHQHLAVVSLSVWKWQLGVKHVFEAVAFLTPCPTWRGFFGGEPHCPSKINQAMFIHRLCQASE
jgi:hypothetical protein